MTGGGEDFAGGFGQREAELDLADLELGSGVCTEQVGYGGSISLGLLQTAFYYYLHRTLYSCL